MKDFEKLINECEADLRSIGIKIGNVKKYSINTRAKSRWGQCKQVGENSFEINISCRLLTDDISDQAVKDTILHEMLHTVEGCMCHTGKWKELAQKVNRQLPQYNIKRLTSSEEKGIVPDNGIKAEASGKTSKKQPSVGKVTAKPTGKTARKTTKKAPEKPTRKGSGSLFFLLSLVLLVVYIILALNAYSTAGYPSEEARITLMENGYLPLQLQASLFGLIFAIFAIKKSHRKAIVKISRLLCILFLLLAFVAIDTVLG